MVSTASKNAAQFSLNLAVPCKYNYQFEDVGAGIGSRSAVAGKVLGTGGENRDFPIQKTTSWERSIERFRLYKITPCVS